MQSRKAILILAVLAVLAVAPVLSYAQDTPAPSFTPEQLDKLVARIALYPDAARWADQHHYLTGKPWPTRSRRIIFRGIPACGRSCHSLRCSR